MDNHDRHSLKRHVAAASRLWLGICLLGAALSPAQSAEPPEKIPPLFRAPVTLTQAPAAPGGQPPGGTPRPPIRQVPVETRPPAGAPAAPPTAPAESGPPPVRPQPGTGQPTIPGTRLPLLTAPQAPSLIPRRTAESTEAEKQFVEEVVDPTHTLDLVVGRPKIVIFKEVPETYQINDTAIADADLIPNNPRMLTIVGKTVGSTVMYIWFKDPDDPTKKKILGYLVNVIPDPTAKSRLEQVYAALQDEINRTFPDSWVCLSLVGDKLVVAGQAKDIAEATQIIRIVREAAPGGADELARIPFNNINLNLNAGPLAGADYRALLDNYLLAGGPNVINLLRVPGEQQVQLRVTVAEVDRTAARSIGVNFTIQNNAGVVVFGQNTGFIASGGVAPVGGQGNQFGTLANLPIALDNGNIQIAVNALRELHYARTLSEPTLVTMNGQTATLQAGGSFPIPVVAVNGAGGGLQGTQFQPFGVSLFFTPYITDKDRIRLEVQAAVSARDVATGTNIGGAAVPGLTARTFQTTVELREGQTLAVAGLIQNNIGATSTRVPGLGDLPILGRFFAFDRLSAGEQELVILVTPELVHPLEPKEIPDLPGSDLYEPGDLEFYVLGRLESRRQYDYRSPVRTDIDRMAAYRRCDQTYIIGPQGFSDGRW